MDTTKSRLLACASAAAIAGTVMAVSPIAAAPANATTHIRVADRQRADLLRKRVVAIAKSRIGSPYVLGSTGPHSFDCSGLVVYSYKKATGKTLPRTSYSQAGAIEHVGARHRKVGDIVFMNGNGHVALYIGHNKVVQALHPGARVQVNRIEGWYRSRLNGYGRVIFS